MDEFFDEHPITKNSTAFSRHAFYCWRIYILVCPPSDLTLFFATQAINLKITIPRTLTLPPNFIPNLSKSNPLEKGQFIKLFSIIAVKSQLPA
jgi:hypothetical protein